MSAIKIFERFYHKKCYKALFSGPAVEYNRQCLEQERSNFNMETSNSLLDADIPATIAAHITNAITFFAFILKIPPFKYTL